MLHCRSRVTTAWTPNPSNTKQASALCTVPTGRPLTQCTTSRPTQPDTSQITPAKCRLLSTSAGRPGLPLGECSIGL